MSYLMKTLFLITTAIFVFNGCSSDSDSNLVLVENNVSTVEGVAQKGPFLEGSIVEIYKLGDDFERTSDKVSTQTDEDGAYSLKIPWNGLSELEVSGYYYDEITGTDSSEKITLNSFVIVDQGKIISNINIFTYLAFKRLKVMLKSGDSYEAAYSKVVDEIEKLFGLEFGEYTEFDKLDLTDFDSDKSSMNLELLRVSVALLKSTNPSAFLAELLEKYNQDGVEELKEADIFKDYEKDRADVNLSIIIEDFQKQGIVDPDLEIDIEKIKDVNITHMDLDDINISVEAKGVVQFSTIFTDGNITIYTQAMHGDAEAYFVGNEIWDLVYTSNDCFIGEDSFVYRHNGEYGRINITITSPLSVQASDFSKTIFGDEVLNKEYLIQKSDSYSVNIVTQPLHGGATIYSLEDEHIYYSYNPQNNYVGNDYFEYAITQTINECPYTSVGKVEFNIEQTPSSVYLFDWDDGTHGIELFRSDGTLNGTYILKDINPGANYSNPGIGAKIGDVTYFSANDGLHSTELWRTDGTVEGTYMLKDINSGDDDGSFPYYFTSIDSNVYFFAMSGDNNGSSNKGEKGIWKSDGTSGGTVLLENFGDFSNTSFGAPGYLHAFGDKLMFLKDDAAGGGYQWEPWIKPLDGLSVKLKDIKTGDEGSGFKCEIILNSKCYGSADSWEYGSEIWVSDGTSGGTNILKDINTDISNGDNTSGSIPSYLTFAEDKFFFMAYRSSEGFAIWKSDGTSEGTVMVKDLLSDVASYNDRDHFFNFTGVGNKLFFTFEDSMGKQVLYTSDGTSGGTKIVKEISSGDSRVFEMANVAGTLFFWYQDSDNDSVSGLYKTDGTSTGTSRIKAFSGNVYYVISLKADDSRAYFELENSNGFKEFWTSDGTEEGTIKLLSKAMMVEE